MAKKASLFFLVRSMTKSEKRYFKLSIQGRKEDANYLQLFDVIDKQEEYDEQAVKDHFEGAAMTRQLHVAKIYLTELILKSLRNYHADKSVNSRILDMLRDIEILFRKELYDTCSYRIEKAEKLAIAYEKDALLVAIEEWKRKLLLARSGNREEIDNMLGKEKAAIARLGELNVYWERMLDMPAGFRPGELPNKLKNIKTSGLQSEILQRHLFYSYYFMNGQPAKAEKEISGLITTLEQHPMRIKEDPSAYVTAISNKIGLLFSRQRWEEIESLVQLMRSVPVQYQLDGDSKFTIRLWLRIFNLELELYRDTRQLDKGIALIAEVEAYMKKHDKGIPPHYRIMLSYQAAVIYFYKGRLSQALDSVNAIISTNFGDVKEDLQCYARVLNLVLHFELDNIIVLRYAVDNCRRFFRKKKNAIVLQDRVLAMFSALSHAAPPEYKDILRRSYKDLFQNDSSDVRNFLDYVDLASWIEHKLKRKPA